MIQNKKTKRQYTESYARNKNEGTSTAGGAWATPVTTAYVQEAVEGKRLQRLSSKAKATIKNTKLEKLNPKSTKEMKASTGAGEGDRKRHL